MQQVEHFVYMSSAGVYLKSDIMPHTEGDAVDVKSRHKGKLNTEAYVARDCVDCSLCKLTYTRPCILA
jgi:UDP-glucose 4-epimerase